jgi:hypothetical protein
MLDSAADGYWSTAALSGRDLAAPALLLAEALDVELITLDRRIARAPGVTCAVKTRTG